MSDSIQATKRVWTPMAINGLDLAFGPGRFADLMPPYSEIPDQFKHGRGKWCQFFSDLFFLGIKEPKMVPKQGIDTIAAFGHLKAITRSFQPSHEHKEAAVAFLASEWFEDSSTWTPWTPGERK